MKDLLGSLAFGTNLSSVLIVAATFLILWLLQLDNWIWISCAVVVGLLVGIIIGRSTEYYTSQSYRPTQKLSESGKTGPATVIISGIGLGMLSTAIPVIAVVIGIIASYLLASAGDFANVGMGLYGIGIAAVGMLSTLGITLATDAYGPIADNAGGNAEMSGLGAEVRKRTDALDSLGNTTAATGKGFAIGSAALTGLALLASYIEEIRIGLTRLGNVDLTFADGSSISVANATFIDFMDYYEVHLMNPKVLSGMFLGSMMAFLFCGLTMNAVGGLSVANVLTKEMVRSMNADPIVFALANPNPEISYADAMASRDDIIFATGRSDYPNQINNVLGFPYIFRGALDTHAKAINEEMKRAAVYAIADLAKEPVPDVVNAAYKLKRTTFGRDYILPKALDPRLLTRVSCAVAKAAIDSGVSRKTITDWEGYANHLREMMGYDNKLLRSFTDMAKANPKRVVFAEANHVNMLKAAAEAKADTSHSDGMQPKPRSI